MKTTTRLTAEERRTDVVAAASHEFAARGYAGTSTQAIAERAGVSQPYLFQLFGTKKGLFIAAVHACFTRTRSTFDATGKAAAEAGGDPMAVLEAMGCSYHDLLRDGEMLRLQLHAYAACDDPDIRTVVREEWSNLHETVVRVSGADPAAIHAWFAEGMLLNVAASIGHLDDAMDLKLDLGGAFGRH